MGAFLCVKSVKMLADMNKLVEDQRVLFNDDLYTLHHPSFYEYIQSLDASSGIDERTLSDESNHACSV